MSRLVKILLIFLALIIIIFMGFVVMCFIITAGEALDTTKLVSFTNTITFYDSNGLELSEENNNVALTDISEIPDHVRNAFIAIEDKRFYSHHGIDYKGLLRASFNNITSFSFKQGASTISQQLIKNTHLTNKKTVKRKLLEIKLAKQLERKYSKNEILAMYLNTIYFGNNSYGITTASKNFFNKTPSELTINEGAMLAGIIKAPSKYSPFVDETKCINRKNIVLTEMLNQGYIDKPTFEKCIKEKLSFSDNKIKCGIYNYQSLVKKELDEILEARNISPNGLKVYTYCDIDKQDNIEHNIKLLDISCDKSSIIIDKNNKILAYYSTCGDINRPMGSTIKPLLVYAPALEDNVIIPSSKILDEKTDFNGYSPSNYNNAYYGYISAKEALAKSLNVCSAKILQLNGVNNSMNYLKLLELPCTDNDYNLASALGITEKGAKLSQIVGAYSVFLSDGYYSSPSCISMIKDNFGKVLYDNNINVIKKRVFSQETVYFINDMLAYAVTNGTSKKLSFSNVELCGKTGTVGNKNGNTDIYSISYNPEYCVGVWLGNKDNSLLENKYTGGGLPCNIASNIWNSMYKIKARPPIFTQPESIEEVLIDKTSYNENNIIELANENTPIKATLPILVKKYKCNLPTSKRYNLPTVTNQKISVNSKGILTELCLTEYTEAQIYRINNGKEILVFDSKNSLNKSSFLDCNVKPNSLYEYYILPYVEGKNGIKFGNKIYLPKIKTPTEYVGEDWWIDDID